MMRFAIVLLSTVLLPSLSQAKTTLRFCTPHGPEEVVSAALTQFKAEVEAKTKGRVAVKLLPQFHPTADLNGNNFKNFQDVAEGKVDMSQIITSVLATRVPEMQALDVPYVFRDHEHAFAVVDGPIGQELFAKLHDNTRVEGLAYTYSGGHRVIAARAKEVRRPDDLANLKIGSVLPVSERIFYSSLGATVVPREADMAKDLTEGKIDAILMAYPEYLHAAQWWKGAPVVSTMHSTIQFTALVINQRSLARLRPTDREVVRSAARSAAKLERRLSVAMEQEAVQSREKLGLKIVELSKEERAEFALRSAKMNWASYLGVPAELIERVRDQTSGASVAGN